MFWPLKNSSINENESKCQPIGLKQNPELDA